jgi:SAM-dependent methyltransferase
MRRFRRATSFDLAVCLFGSFGYFEDPADDRVVLAHVREALRPGGAFVFDCAGKETLAKRFAALSCHDAPNGAIVVLRRRIEGDWARTRNAITVVRGDRARTYPYSFNLYSGQEIKQAVLDAGFAEVSLHGELDGRPYDGDAEKLVVVARRSA